MRTFAVAGNYTARASGITRNVRGFPGWGNAKSKKRKQNDTFPSLPYYPATLH